MGWLQKLLSRKPDEASAAANALAEAQGKWRAACREYREAKSAGDTRRMGEAHRRARHLALEAVRLEVGR